MSEEWMSSSTIQVSPDAKFRQDLQRALEQTHRQQLVQRQLGTRPARRDLAQRRETWLAASLLLLILLVGAYLLRPSAAR